jgi:chromosome partitioning protein
MQTFIRACHRRRNGDLRVREPEGRVGKTTIALGVASALVRRGARPLLIDLDPQASATKVLGIDVEERCTVADALLEPERYRLPNAVVRTEWRFDVVPSETALASRESRRSTADEFVLRRQLERVSGYDVTLIDCPPSLGVLTLNALTAASQLVVVTEPSFLALQGIDELLETRNLVQAHYNSDLELAGVIVNRVERTVEHRAGVAEIESHFGGDLVWSPYLPKRTVLQDGARLGVPLAELPTRAARDLATGFVELAERIAIHDAA